MKNDFSTGNVRKNILLQAIPLMLAQLAQLAYNITDRIYIGHLPNEGAAALTGIGLVFPITTLIAAFTQFYINGGVPLFSIARGAREEDRAERILTLCFTQLFVISFFLFFLCFFLRRPILYLFGASDASYVYADTYLKIYLFGTLFIMMSTGLNGFINAQGYPQIGMGTVVIGAVINILLDPLFIFVLKMGVSGAALASVLSQSVSFLWVMIFFFGKKTGYRIRLCYVKPDWKLTGQILGLGTSGFIMRSTNCAVQVVFNVMLRTFGGDLYVGIMTIINSLREVLELPFNGLTSGAQPVLSYNYGAKRYDLVKRSIRFSALLGAIYTMTVWILILTIPRTLISVFTSDPEILEYGVRCTTVYFFGFVFMTLQNVGQATFTALKCTRRAVFFSLLRKAFIVIPLAILLPRFGFGIDGILAAEPISNLVGGAACCLTMYLTIYRKLGKELQ